MIKSVKIFGVLAGLFFVSCSNQSKFLKTVEKVDINKYMGIWYEIARYDHTFEKGLKCVSAQYTLREDGKITVLNTGIKEDNGEKKTAKGIAKIPDTSKPGILKVSFFRPFWGNYYIIDLDENYSRVIVGDPSRNYLWILSREKSMDNEIYLKLLKIASDNGFDVSKLIKIKHDCTN